MAIATILIAGDRAQLRALVRAEGYAVETAEPPETLARLRAERVDLVVLDSLDLLDAIRGEARFARVPVLLVADAADEATVARGLERGADDYLTRPIQPAILRTRLRAALDHKRLEATEQDLVVARKIQEDFLPQALPAVPGVAIDAVLRPAREVSGDFYDAFVLAPGDTTILVVGDVCDKGIGAALFMALFRSLIRAAADPVEGGAIQMIGGRRSVVMRSLEAASPADLLTRVAGFTNDYIARLHGRTNMFATVFLGALTPHSGRLDYVNAGHEPALVIAPDGSIRTLKPTGPALGLRPEVGFTAGQVELGPGHGIVAFTDGLVEARSPSGASFGAERLREALADREVVAKFLVGGVMRALDAFTQNAERHDDVTLLAATLPPIA